MLNYYNLWGLNSSVKDYRFRARMAVAKINQPLIDTLLMPSTELSLASKPRRSPLSSVENTGYLILIAGWCNPEFLHSFHLLKRICKA